MELEFTAGEEAFRQEVREFIRANLSDRTRQKLVEGRPIAKEDLVEWTRILHKRGWSTPRWPKEYGGTGWTPIQQYIFIEETLAAPAPEPLAFGVSMVGPVIYTFGSAGQKARFLPGIANLDDWWCQGFSEPGAGSDLGSLTCRAEIDGDHLVVNGQKTWTSYAHVADLQELLVRTDPDAPKHKGISWVVCDMTTPGIEIREIRTMSHVTDFCEVFYDEVRIPLTNVVGGLHNGWRTAMSTLSFERGTAFMADQVELTSTIERLIGEAQERTDAHGRPLIGDEEVARRLATARAEVDALKAMTIAGISRTARTGMPGAEGSMIRFFHGELHQRVYQLALDIIGADALRLTPVDGDVWTGPYLQSFAYTIGGGTTDIQRNIVGERVLGLPRA